MDELRFRASQGTDRARGYCTYLHILAQLHTYKQHEAKTMRAALDHCCEQPAHEQWVPLFKIQVFFSCVSFSIIVPSLANYLRRMGADEWVLGVAVAVYSLGEMVQRGLREAHDETVEGGASDGAPALFVRDDGLWRRGFDPLRRRGRRRPVS